MQFGLANLLHRSQQHSWKKTSKAPMCSTPSPQFLEKPVHYLWLLWEPWLTQTNKIRDLIGWEFRASSPHVFVLLCCWTREPKQQMRSDAYCSTTCASEVNFYKHVTKNQIVWCDFFQKWCEYSDNSMLHVHKLFLASSGHSSILPWPNHLEVILTGDFELWECACVWSLVPIYQLWWPEFTPPLP